MADAQSYSAHQGLTDARASTSDPHVLSRQVEDFIIAGTQPIRCEQNKETYSCHYGQRGQPLSEQQYRNHCLKSRKMFKSRSVPVISHR